MQHATHETRAESAPMLDDDVKLVLMDALRDAGLETTYWNTGGNVMLLECRTARGLLTVGIDHSVLCTEHGDAPYHEDACNDETLTECARCNWNDGDDDDVLEYAWTDITGDDYYELTTPWYLNMATATDMDALRMIQDLRAWATDGETYYHVEKEEVEEWVAECSAYIAGYFTQPRA